MSLEEWKAKERLIVDVLRGEKQEGGNDEEAVVDLWKLRELALSKGGLLCPRLRRRAWPTLVRAHEQVLQVSASTSPHGFVTPSARDIKALKDDCSKTIWAIEEYLVASRAERRASDKKLERYLAFLRQRSKKVKFSLPEELDIRPPENVEDGLAPKAASISPTSQISDEEDEDHETEEKMEGGDESSEKTPGSNEQDEEEEMLSTKKGDESVVGDGSFLQEVDDEEASLCLSEKTISTSFTFTSRAVQWRKASTNEQKILYNIVLNVLRTQAPSSNYFEDDRYFVSFECVFSLMNIFHVCHGCLIGIKVAGEEK